MPIKLDSADRKLLLIASAVLIVSLTISVAVSPPSGESLPYPSPYSTASGGAKAAYSLLPQLGYEVEHWRRPPSKLMEHGINTILVVAEPTQNATPEDRESVHKYVRSGGMLLAIGANSAQLLPHAGLAPGIPRFAWANYRALLPSAITNGAPQVVMAPGTFWRKSDPAADVQYGDSTGGVVASYKFGKGEVIWWATTDPLTNSGITQAGNLQLFLNSLGPAGTRTVLWDDYFHEGETTMMDSLFASPLKWSLLQLGLLAVAVIATYSRRHGPVRPLVEPSRLATLEFVETLGALYQRARATELPVQVAYERFRFLLHRKLGISASATVRQVADRLQDRMGELAAQLEPTLSECESARYQHDLEQERSLRLVKSLELFSERLKLTSKAIGMK